MTLIKELAFSGLACSGITLALATMSISAAHAQECQTGQLQVERIQQSARPSRPTNTVKRVSYINASGNVVRQQTVVITAN